jgi:hypothetical protein
MLKKLFSLVIAAMLLVCGCAAPTASTPSEPQQPANPALRPDGMKLLVIGHSNTCMSAYELWPIFNNLGYKNFTLGVMWRGDSTFKVHASLAKSDEKGLAYHKPTLEKFSDPSESKAENLKNYSTVLQDEEWDTVVIYQGGNSFLEDTQYRVDLNLLLNKIRQYRPNAAIYYGMNYAYPAHSTTPSFKPYGFDQQAMHDASVAATRNHIEGNERIDGIIPLSTLMQSLRTKYGEVFHVNDLVHINTTGSYVVGMMWYATLTGLPLDDLTYIPAGVPADIAADAKALIPRILADPYTVIDISEK